MSEGIVYADVKFKKHQKTEGKDGAGDPDSQKGLKVKPGGYDPVKVVLVTLCVLLMGTVIGLVFLYISNLPTKNTELQILQAAYNRNLTSVRQQIEELRKQKTPPSCPTNTGNNDGPQPMNCAEGWEYYGGKCYYFSPDKLTWAQSRDECITRGGHLVIIESLEEQKFLDQKTGTKISKEPEDKFWIGLTDSINENEWLWVDNSSLITSFWLGEQEPDDWREENPDGEDCARMGECGGTKDGKSWLDVNCNKTQRRICETKSPL
ncbi:CD209 antigen-like protein E isoform X6 [Oncorhynchus tshawytscha]|uniref:CD209 antigen-like protein E isoform X6 n=1 Tax=Oncorhynchus tshawytscha TaxID=74940 RepID=UPI001C3E6BAB|nr:CD209 antigen-like protein E isoform X6 [Oncorhynchus tshawytscha]